MKMGKTPPNIEQKKLKRFLLSIEKIVLLVFKIILALEYILCLKYSFQYIRQGINQLGEYNLFLLTKNFGSNENIQSYIEIDYDSFIRDQLIFTTLWVIIDFYLILKYPKTRKKPYIFVTLVILNLLAILKVT